jgi:hypothetical protein
MITSDFIRKARGHLLTLSKLPIDTKQFPGVLEDCGVQMTITQRGWLFSYLRTRFTSFTVHTEIKRLAYREETYRFKELTAHFPGTAILLPFINGSILLIFPSGHIRWITESGFRYYATLCQGARPDYCQGDLAIFQLAEVRVLPHRHILEDMLPQDQGTIWCRTNPVDPKSVGNWQEVEELGVGGNTRHLALGRMKYLTPIIGDHRTVQIQTIERIFIDHDPIDDVHPAIYLLPNRHYLISKIPGFSDPIIEMTPCREVSP